jgi:hypothetical protein
VVGYEEMSSETSRATHCASENMTPSDVLIRLIEGYVILADAKNSWLVPRPGYKLEGGSIPFPFEVFRRMLVEQNVTPDHWFGLGKLTKFGNNYKIGRLEMGLDAPPSDAAYYLAAQ